MANDKEERKKKVMLIVKYFVLIVVILGVTMGIYGAYIYGTFIGTVEGAYQVGGIEYICNVTNNPIWGEYCILSDDGGNYTHYIHCDWGKFIVKSKYSAKYMNLNYGMIFTQCKRVKVESAGQSIS